MKCLCFEICEKWRQGVSTKTAVNYYNVVIQIKLCLYSDSDINFPTFKNIFKLKSQNGEKSLIFFGSFN